MLRYVLAVGILLLSAATAAQDPARDREAAERQDTIDRIVEGTRSLDAFFVPPGCEECERISSDVDLEDWSVLYKKRSGVGGLDGFRIWSDGRIALCSRRSCEEFKHCLSLRAEPTMLNLLEEQIRRFEVPATGERMVLVPDSCMDETEHVVRVSVGDARTGFIYSASRSCRRGNEPPDWMIDTVEMMRSHMEWIRNCHTEAGGSLTQIAPGNQMSGT